MTDAGAVSGTGEASIGDKRDRFAEALADDVGSRGEHFLHAGSALGSFIANDDDVAGLDASRKDALASVLLRIEANGLAGELHHGRRDTALLDDGALLREIAPKDGEAAILRVGIRDGADDIGVFDFCRAHLLPDCFTAHRWARGVEKWRRGDTFQDGHDAACAIDVDDVVGAAGGDLADVRRRGRNFVHALEGIIDAGFAGDGERMEDGVGRAAHGHIESQGVIEGVACDEVAWAR